MFSHDVEYVASIPSSSLTRCGGFDHLFFAPLFSNCKYFSFTASYFLYNSKSREGDMHFIVLFIFFILTLLILLTALFRRNVAKIEFFPSRLIFRCVNYKK